MTSDGHAARRGRLIDIVGGALLGGIVGAIAAVNFVIFLGPDAGYESSIRDVFADSVVVGILTVARTARRAGRWCAHRPPGAPPQ